MKIDRFIIAFAFVMALAVSPVLAQQKPAAAAAPAQGPINVPASKIAMKAMATRPEDRYRTVQRGGYQFESRIPAAADRIAGAATENSSSE